MLAPRLAALKAAGRRALVCYVTAGHPDRDRSIALVRVIAAAGADVIELGVPFSDPVADGPVIQASSQRALELGMTLDGTLGIAADAGVDVPLVLFSYLNPLLAAGPDVLNRAKAAGISGHKKITGINGNRIDDVKPLLEKGEIDVYVISGDETHAPTARMHDARPPTSNMPFG